MPTLCEFAWVLARGYERTKGEIAAAIRRFVDAEGVEVDRPCLRAGLAMLQSGGDFADGVIAFEGRRLGGRVVASFDPDAVARVEKAGGEARLLS